MAERIMMTREQVRDILDNVTTDALVTKQHAEAMTDEICEALTARGLIVVPQSVLDAAMGSANRWAYKYTLLATWMRSNCTDTEIEDAREFVDDGVAASPLAPEPPTDKPRYTTPGVHPQYDMLPAADGDAIVSTLARFGWEATPMFRDKYANDAWFHNVVNALVALSTEPGPDR